MRGGFWLGINKDNKSSNYGYLADVVLQNITFETITNPLFQFAPMTGTKYSKMIGVDDFTFDGIHVPMGQHWRSIFGPRPEAPDDHLKNIVIKDLYLGHQKMTQLKDFADTRGKTKNLDIKIK
jgi:hypothetical protein